MTFMQFRLRTLLIAIAVFMVAVAVIDALIVQLLVMRSR